MEKIFAISILVTILFCVAKFIEMKYVDKKWQPLKLIAKDALIVMICSFISIYIMFSLDANITEFFNVVTDKTIINPSNTQIFTDDPGF
jgi:hypothetical protein